MERRFLKRNKLREELSGLRLVVFTYIGESYHWDVDPILRDALPGRGEMVVAKIPKQKEWRKKKKIRNSSNGLDREEVKVQEDPSD